jgi:hypothetical protein
MARAKPQGDNFWWLEVGGTRDTIADADAIRDELLAIAYGTWAYIKNHPDGRGHGWELEWIGFLPGKRENVRYVGDHVLSQREVEACGVFPDLACHGGWSMDDHHPLAFRHPGAPTVFHPAPSPYGIPWRCLYSANIENLLFAGRNISCTHLAMSSTRVMATCATMGQALGTGAALAIRHGCSPRQVGERHLTELQNRLLDDDQWLPDRRRGVPAATRAARLAASHGDAEPLRDGFDRRCRGADHAWEAPPGASVTFSWDAPRPLGRLRLVGDSELHRMKRQPCSWPLAGWAERMPAPLPRDLAVEVQETPGGPWRQVARIAGNRRRLVVLPLPVQAVALRLVVERAWGDGAARIFSCEVGEPDFSAPHEVLPWPVPAVSGTAKA